MNRGFTVVELLITLVVIGILLGLGTVGLRGTLANGRDSERKADIETLARGFEYRYNNGNAKNALPTTNPTYWPNPTQQGKGYYAGTDEVWHMTGGDRSDFTPQTITGGYLGENLQGVSRSAWTSPSDVTAGYICGYICQPAGDATQLANAFGYPANTKDIYMYEPVDENGNMCLKGNCVAFNLYWISETDNTVYKGIPGLKIVRSKHQ